MEFIYMVQNVKNLSDAASAPIFYQGSESCCWNRMIFIPSLVLTFYGFDGQRGLTSPLHSLHLQNFYNQCFQDDTLVMIKDSTPVDRKQLDPNKVGSVLVLPHKGPENAGGEKSTMLGRFRRQIIC